MKLFAFIKGDYSVGIPDQQFTIEAPFEREDVEEKDLDDFRTVMEIVYSEYSGEKVGCDYDFELKAEAEAEEQML